MFITHYAKVRPKRRWDDDIGQILTPNESLLYAAADSQTLFSKASIIDRFISMVQARPQEYANASMVTSVLNVCIEQLIKKGYFKEVHGVRIEKFLESF